MIFSKNDRLQLSFDKIGNISLGEYKVIPADD